MSKPTKPFAWSYTALTGHRKQRGTRLTLDEPRQVLDEFWADVDDNIKQGNLPKYE